MLPHHLISLQLISLNIETRLRSCKLFLSLIDSIVAVLSTFCVDDTPVSTQLRLTTKDTSHMRDNAWPEDNKNGIIIQRLKSRYSLCFKWSEKYDNAKEESTKPRKARILDIRTVTKRQTSNGLGCTML